MSITRTTFTASFDLQTAKAWVASYFFWFFYGNGSGRLT